jgi:hypothetical protein
MADTGVFQHFVITRYFVRFSERTDDRESQLRAEPDWLDNRLELFKTFCLPSVVAQSDQNFRWYLYFDEGTPAAYLAKVQELVSPYANMELKICRLFTREMLEDDIRAGLRPETKWVLTTRLDNDDAWHRDFVKTLHRQTTFDRREFLNFPVGLIYYNRNIYLYRHLSNAFISLIEPTEGMLTVWCGAHAFLGKIAPIRQLRPFPAFLQVVHGQTRSNKPRGVRIHRVVALEGFEAIPELFDSPRDSDLGILWDGLISAPQWALRDRLVAFARGAARRVVAAGFGGTRVARLLRALTVDH